MIIQSRLQEGQEIRAPSSPNKRCRSLRCVPSPVSSSKGEILVVKMRRYMPFVLKTMTHCLVARSFSQYYIFAVCFQRMIYICEALGIIIGNFFTRFLGIIVSHPFEGLCENYCRGVSHIQFTNRLSTSPFICSKTVSVAIFVAF